MHRHLWAVAAAFEFSLQLLLRKATVREETPTVRLPLPSDPLLVNPEVHMYTVLIPRRGSGPGGNLELIAGYFGS